jgi:hypothetical protein
MTGTPTKVDRIDSHGDICEHQTIDAHRTLCGIEIGQRQSPCGNRPCKRCEKALVAGRRKEIVVRLSETPASNVDEMKAP